MSQPIPDGSLWRLKSGRLIEVDGVIQHGTRVECFYIDRYGKRIMPVAKNEVTLSVAFFEVYATPYRLDGLH